jgi:hypothetical protein
MCYVPRDLEFCQRASSQLTLSVYVDGAAVSVLALYSLW